MKYNAINDRFRFLKISKIALFLSPLILFSSIVQAIGPFNYYIRDEHVSDMLANVERNHLSPEIITLQQSLTGSIWGDLDYTLRAFPNHPVALNSMARLFREKNKYGHNFSTVKRFELYSDMDPKRSSAEYYLERAIEFAPDDAFAYMIYGVHLQKTKKYEQAIEKYKAAESLQPNHPEVHYNLGLLYYELKQYEEARNHAIIAYDNGYPLPGLKNKLAKSGHWE